MNKLFFVLLVFGLFSCNNYRKAQNSIKSDSLINTERLKLKNYGFCKCLTYQTDITKMKDGSIIGYLEMSKYSTDAYETIDSFIFTKIKDTTYYSKDGNNLFLMKCLDIYNSPKYDSVIKKMDLYLQR